MTAYAADPSLTLAAARDEYFRVNDFGANGNYDAAWVDFKLGPIPMPFPNVPARRRAVRFHDLHHAVTGYGTDTLGEFEISAWEIGSGCGTTWVAWQLDLGGLVAGVMTIPRRTWRAFVRGRQSRNLFAADYEAVLGRRVGEVRRELGLDEPPAPARAVDVALFGAAAVAGFVVGTAFLALVLPLAAAANVWALVARRRGEARG